MKNLISLISRTQKTLFRNQVLNVLFFKYPNNLFPKAQVKDTKYGHQKLNGFKFSLKNSGLEKIIRAQIILCLYEKIYFYHLPIKLNQ